VERGRQLAEAIRARVPLDPSMHALDYGCGTGLLSFPLRDALGHITLQDSSPGMLAVLLVVLRVEADHYPAATRDCAPPNLRALQIVWPDGRDLFPWQDGYDETFRWRQIVLHLFARTRGRR
jgi:SAM-dependent methyltransferase